MAEEPSPETPLPGSSESEPSAPCEGEGDERPVASDADPAEAGAPNGPNCQPGDGAAAPEATPQPEVTPIPPTREDVSVAKAGARRTDQIRVPAGATPVRGPPKVGAEPARDVVDGGRTGESPAPQDGAVTDKFEVRRRAARGTRPGSGTGTGRERGGPPLSPRRAVPGSIESSGVAPAMARNRGR